jgi:hypothetical protein
MINLNKLKMTCCFSAVDVAFVFFEGVGAALVLKNVLGPSIFAQVHKCYQTKLDIP